MARRRKMDPERKAFINSLLEHYQPKDAQDIQDMLKDLLGETLQGMLEAEMDDHLGYSKYDYKNKETDDSRNGYSPKTITSSMGTIDLDIPRDRNKYTYSIDISTALKLERKYFIRKDTGQNIDIIKLMTRYVHAVKTEFRQFHRPLRGIGAIHCNYR
nr:MULTISPECIES: transposase [Clostridia]